MKDAIKTSINNLRERILALEIEIEQTRATLKEQHERQENLYLQLHRLKKVATEKRLNL